MQTDVLFNVNPDAPLITEAIIALETQTNTAWPLNEVNKALAHCYGFALDDPSLAPVQMYPVVSRGVDCGYLIMERDDTATDQECADVFWEMLTASDSANELTRTYTDSPPFFRPGAWGDTQVGIAVYTSAYGPTLPVEAINHALWQILSQPIYPLSYQQPYLYQIPAEKSSETIGLWIAERQDGIDMTSETDLPATSFRNIAAMNHIHRRRHTPDSGFSPRRFSA